MEINRNNYETFFLLYLDRELNPSEMLEVENFVAANTDLQKEFSLLGNTVLVPTQIEFSQKELLFRKENKRRVIPIYWTRIAAAIAVLVLGSWLITVQLAVKKGSKIAGSESKKNTAPAKKNVSGQEERNANNNTADLTSAPVNKIQTTVQQPAATENKSQKNQQNNAVTKNQSIRNSTANKSSMKPQNDLPLKNDQSQSVAVSPDHQTSAESPDGSNLVMQKSSAQELQPVYSQNEADPKQISALPGSHSPALVIAAGSGEKVKDGNAAFADNDDQTDNAISVVALNEKNKGITRIFKKLTAKTPTDENQRKVRVSVFQFSY